MINKIKQFFHNADLTDILLLLFCLPFILGVNIAMFMIMVAIFLNLFSPNSL
jgi:hypothetical protein